MKKKHSRRKFIATTVSGVVISAGVPMTLVKGKPLKQPTIFAKDVFPPESVDLEAKRVHSSEFIIFPWGVMPSAPASDAWGDIVDMNAMMKDLYDCGFNTSGFTSVQNLKHVQNNHLTGILRTDIDATQNTTQKKADEMISALLASITDSDDREAVYAIYVRDEPNASLFPQLNIWSEAIKKHGVIPYINLFPDYASSQQLGTKDYEEHLKQYVDICKPKYISYDNYSLFEGGRLEEDRFFGNLESVRKKSLQAGIPFWNVILGNAHFNYAEPSAATLGIQVYSTLAYGGKGIGYFTYYTPQRGNYRLAPIDRFGYRTKTWEMMRNINLQIHSLVPMYNKLKSINTFHTGHIPRNGQGFESAKLIARLKGPSLLVGEFVDSQGKPYAMVVNKNMQSSVQFSIEFKGGDKIVMISQANQGRVPFTGEQDWLAPGHGSLLTIE